MNRRTWIVLGGMLAGVVLFGAGFLVGDYAFFGREYKTLQRSYFAERLGDFLVMKENLERREMTPELREHLKDRLYFLAASLPAEQLPPEYRDFDFGPVDRALLRGLRATVRSDMETKSYELAKARHNPRPGKLGYLVQSNPTAEADARNSGARGSP